ncbi:MAG: hypothetical protein Kow0099_17860 [Candidatus Abyssubacteria bacterium]
MNRHNSKIVILFAAVVVAFVLQLTRLFALRFESGDVFPEYSSLRSDPLGVRAFYEALGSLDGISVTRNTEPIVDIGSGRDKTLIICGAYPSEDPEEEIRALEGFALEGGRLVVAFHPIFHAPAVLRNDEKDTKAEKKDDKKKEKKENGDDSKDDENTKDEDDFWSIKFVSIEDRWGFKCDYAPLPRAAEEDIYPAVEVQKQDGPESLPSSLPWHSALFFTRLAEAWRPIYSRDGQAVVMERRWGQGTIVLLADSYLLSNEAMRKERHSTLLTWLVGPSSTVIFEETQHNVRDNPGIMTLIRGYRLDGVLAVVLLLAALFVWQNAYSLVPRRGRVALEDGVSGNGRDSASGLINLLRRSIPTRKLILVCCEEWVRSIGHNPTVGSGTQARVQAVVDREMALPLNRRDPVRAYKKICEILKERDT